MNGVRRSVVKTTSLHRSWTLSVARTASLHRSWAPVSGVGGLATTHPLHRSRGLAEIEKLFLGPNCKNRCRCWCSASIHRLWTPVHSVAIVAAAATAPNLNREPATAPASQRYDIPLKLAYPRECKLPTDAILNDSSGIYLR